MDSMSDYFISRDGQQMLVELLREIPGLVEDLAVTLTRQDRTGKGGMKISSGDCTQPLPINLAASDAKDELHNELASWARHVCESRGLAYDGDGSVLGIARWLDNNVIALAMTEGSEEAYGSIEKAMGRCRRAMDIAPEDAVKVDPEQIAAAWGLELNAKAVVSMAKLMGGDCAALTKRRMDYLTKEARVVGPIRYSGKGRAEIAIFQFGKVMDAHMALLERESA